MVEDQERRQAVDALLIRLREETESVVRGFVDDVVTRADADRQRALDEARRAADAAVAAARTNARAAAEEVVAVQLKEAEARHVVRVAELEEKLARTREELGAERAAAVAETRKQAKGERAAAVAEVREEAAAEQAAAVAEVRKRAEAEQAAAVAEVRERAEAERAEAVAEVREQAEAQQAVAVARLRTDAAAEQAAALSRARTEAAVEQAAAVSRVRKEAAAAQQEAVAQAQEAGTQAALAAGSGVSAGPEDEVRLALDYGHPGAGPGTAVGDAADDAARVSQVLDSIRHLDEQTTLTAVLDTLTDAAADYASRAALFVRVDGEMRAWRLSGFDPEVGEAGDPVLNGDGSGFLGRAIAEGRALVLTPPPGEDELDWPPAFAGLPPDRSAIAVPVSIGGQSMVALYADDAHREGQSAPAEWSDAIELLARHAGCCIEALTAGLAAGAARSAPPAAEPNPAGSPPDGAFGRPSPAG